MPNDVYRAAVDGLTALVPPRAARRLVDDSLRATKRTSDDVSVAAMRRLLLGPIRDELAGVLPPSAIGPGLKRIAAELHGEASPRRRWWRRGRADPKGADDQMLAEELPQNPNAADPAEQVDGGPVPALTAASKAVATSGPATSVKSSMISKVPPADQAAIEAAVVEGADGRAASEESRVSPASARSKTPPTVSGPARAATAFVRPSAGAPLPRLDDGLFARALKAFGELETVRQVVAVGRGELVGSSGEGLDPEELPALVHATTTLLGRAGRVNVFALERTSGAMFLFPFSGGGLVVLTKPKVNFGAVLTARAALEEAA